MKKRIVFALVAVLLVIGYLAQPESDPPAGEGTPAATMAEVWASTANARLDIPMEQFFSQIPDDLASAYDDVGRWQRCRHALEAK